MRIARTAQNSKLPADFHRLLIAWSSSLIADGMRFAAVPLLALSTRGTAAAVAAVAAAMSLPWLLVALPAGALVDRLDPARVIAGANVCRAAAVMLVVFAISTHQVSIALLCAVGFGLTAAETFADSAAQSLLVRMVPSPQLERANARFVGFENLGLDLVGPLAAGALFVWASWLPFALAGGIFLAAGAFVMTLPGHRQRVSRTSDGAPGAAAGPWAGDSSTDPDPGAALVARPSVREGIRAIFSDPDLRALVITVVMLAGSIAAAEGVLVIYSTSSLHLSEALYPTLLACYSLGLLTSAAVVSRWVGSVRPGPSMIGAVVLIGATLIATGLFPRPVVAWCCFALMGAAGGTWNILSATRRQRRTPRHMVARVSSTFRAIGWGALPVGTMVGGWIGQNWGVPTVFVIAGAVVLALGMAVAPFFLRSRTDRPDPARSIASHHAGPDADPAGDGHAPTSTAG